MTFAALFCVLALAFGGSLGCDSTEWNFVTGNNNGNKVRLTVGLNRRNMIIIPDEVKDRKRCSVRTINLHDFEEGLVAIKDPIKRSCWVKPLGKTDTYENAKQAFNSGNDVIQTTEDWLVPKRALDKDQVLREVGNLLADFCSDSEVYMLTRDRQSKNLLVTSKREECGFLCFGCLVRANPIHLVIS
ncbi:uncharacterized protein LOC121386363 isoform X2 [Gigantopelta aegis]|uniref:uncharacterized protein LOC121386363 isoform X2 n=1 Tax=Gigantopelta aegis TaxID=1735272 RepID=UPI001B88902D|nr:uncharacterized protein LOC121386363 isoform X2 [Gigantopelta aegis]